MNRKEMIAVELFEELDCFGNYARSNPLCAKHCVLRLRCAIEQDQIARMEILSDLATVDGTTVTYQ